MPERYLITGGTGKTGALLAQSLVRDGVEVRVGTRSPRIGGQVRFDWTDPSSHAAALEGVDGVYLVAPTDRTDHLAAMRPFLERAVAGGVGRFVLLSASVLPEGGPMMGGVHAWLRAHAPGWVVLRPSWFMQNFTTQHAASIREAGEIASATGDGRVPFIDAADIAAVAAAALRDRQGPSAALVLSGPEALSYGEVAALVSEVAGRDVRHRRLTEHELASLLASNGIDADIASLLAGAEAAIAAGNEDPVTGEVERVTGRAPTALRDFLAANAAAFRPD